MARRPLSWWPPFTRGKEKMAPKCWCFPSHQRQVSPFSLQRVQSPLWPFDSLVTLRMERQLKLQLL